MLPDDPRHGTTAGHQQHLKDGEDACDPCRAAKTRYEKTRNVYGDRLVPAVGVRRRIRALMALGYSGADLARHLDVTYQAIHKLEHGKSDKAFAATAAKVADLYDRLSMTVPIGPTTTRVRNKAKRLRYAPPLAWDEDTIDDPDARPHSRWNETGQGKHLLDHAVVERVLAGEKKPRTLTAAEAAEIIRRCIQRGHSTYEIWHLYGIKVERHHRQGDAA